MIVAGFGCRKDVSAEALRDVLAAALKRSGVEIAELDALATAAEKQSEAAFAQLAEQLSLPLLLIAQEEMERVAGQALSVSARVAELKGVPSVSETCALAAVGRTPRLLAPRAANGTATCAIAVGAGS